MNNNQGLDIPVAYEVSNNNNINPATITIAYEVDMNHYLENDSIIIYERRYDKYTKMYIKIAIKISCFFIILLFMYIFVLK